MLRADGVLPVVAARAPSVQHRRIGDRRRRDVLAEVRRRGRRRELAELQAARRIERLSVAVEIAPRPGVEIADGRLGIRRIGDGDLLTGDVSRDARLHSGPAVAEHVERDAETRRDVLPVLNPSGAVVLKTVQPVRTIVIGLRRIERARRQRLRQRRALEPVESKSGVDRGAADRPAVLAVNAGVELDRVAPVGRQAQCDGDWRAVVVRDGVVGGGAARGTEADVAGELLHQTPTAFGDRAAELERVRAGDVRHRRRLGEQFREVIGGIRPRSREFGVALVENRDERRVRRQDFGLVVLLVFLVVHAEAGVEENPIGLRPRPLRDRDEAGRRRLNRGGLGRNRRRDAPVVPHFVLLVVVVRHLVFGAELRGHASCDAANVAVVDPGPAEIGGVFERRRIQVEEAVGDGLVDAPVTVGGVEPRLVFRDRSADRWIEVPDLFDDADIAQLVVRVERRIAVELRPRARLADRREAAVVRSERVVGVVA